MFNPEIKSQIGEDISILIKVDNHPWNYLCECGDAKELTVKEVQNSNAIFISHTHIDHFVNFDAVIRHQIGLERRIIICGPANISTQIQSRIQSYTWNLIQKGSIIYEIRELISENTIMVYEIEPPLWELKKIGIINGNTIFKEKTFDVTATLLDHKIPTLAYKFKEYDTLKIQIENSGFKGGKWVNDLKNAFENNLTESEILIESSHYKAKDLFHLLKIQVGDTVGVIMDHAAIEENHHKIVQHFESCRKVFIESFYNNADKDLAIINFHSYSIKSGEVMKRAKISEPIPVHYSRKYNAVEIEQLKSEFYNTFNHP